VSSRRAPAIATARGTAVAVPGDQGDRNALSALGARAEIRAERGDVHEFRDCDLDEAEYGARDGGGADGGDVPRDVHEMQDFNSARH
jgi:hypothetical protein